MLFVCFCFLINILFVFLFIFLFLFKFPFWVGGMSQGKGQIWRDELVSGLGVHDDFQRINKNYVKKINKNVSKN